MTVDQQKFVGWCMLFVNHDLSAAQFKEIVAQFRPTLRGTEILIAATEFLKGGKHHGECVYDLPDGACYVHVQAYYLRRNILLALIQYSTASQHQPWRQPP